MKHLIFFDATCSFCQSSVSKILKWDRKRLFCFAPLDGQAAKKWLTGKRASLRFLNTLVLIEGFKGGSPRTWIRAKAVFRIFWLMGGFFKVFGLLGFLPKIVIDPIYRLIARYRFFLPSQTISKKDSSRFIK